MEILKLLIVFLMVALAALSPWLRDSFVNYSYLGGVIINLGAAFITLRWGRNFEKAWGIGFLLLAIHQSLNLFPVLPYFPYIGDVFYMGFYFMLFTGNLIHLWEANSTFMLGTIIVLSVVSAIVSFVMAFSLPLFNHTPMASFFNLFYIIFSGVNLLATVRPALLDRAWILRTLAFGIFLVTEVWFALWAYLNYEPSDPSVMWFGVVILAVLAQRPVSRRMRIVRF